LPCKNADPELSRNNFDLIAPDGDDEGVPLVTVARLRIGNQTIRKNAVLACEMILSISPEYFRPNNPKEPFFYEESRVKEWAEACQNWLLKDYGRNRLLKVSVHLDEVTPHIHVLYVPFDEKGKLNAREFLGCARWKMSQLQDRYHAAIAHLGDGIERGKKKSKAKYQDIRQFYTDVNRSMEEKRKEWAQDIAQIALLARLSKDKDIEGRHYKITLTGDTLQISDTSDQGRGVLIQHSIKQKDSKWSNQLTKADWNYFKTQERQVRFQEIEKLIKKRQEVTR
jgi:hypothetical protein